MRRAISGFGDNSYAVLEIMEAFERHGATVVSVTDGGRYCPMGHEPYRRFCVFGFAEDDLQIEAIDAEVRKINEG